MISFTEIIYTQELYDTDIKCYILINKKDNVYEDPRIRLFSFLM